MSGVELFKNINELTPVLMSIQSKKLFSIHRVPHFDRFVLGTTRQSPTGKADDFTNGISVANQCHRRRFLYLEVWWIKKTFRSLRDDNDLNTLESNSPLFWKPLVENSINSQLSRLKKSIHSLLKPLIHFVKDSISFTRWFDAEAACWSILVGSLEVRVDKVSKHLWRYVWICLRRSTSTSLICFTALWAAWFTSSSGWTQWCSM